MEPNVSIEKILGKSVLIHDGLRLVALASASMIIRECNLWKPTGDVQFNPAEESVFNELNTSVDWAESGIIGALRSHAQIVHAVVCHALDNPHSKNWLIFDEARLLVKALDAFQMWKEDYVKLQRQKKGMDWGSATDLYNEVWNTHSKKLLDLYLK